MSISIIGGGIGGLTLGNFLKQQTSISKSMKVHRKSNQLALELQWQEMQCRF
jgi:2-polyprenyl-6-methoxyphenol hydroxylase-like FAD-dependent oxidoreductase